MPANELRDRCDRKRAARKAAGGEGERRLNWIPLFKRHAAPRYDLLHVFLAEIYPAFARVPLDPDLAGTVLEPAEEATPRRIGIIE